MDLHSIFLMYPPTGRRVVDLARHEDRECLYDMIRDICPGLVILDDLFAITSHPRNWRAVRKLWIMKAKRALRLPPSA